MSSLKGQRSQEEAKLLPLSPLSSGCGLRAPSLFGSGSERGGGGAAGLDGGQWLAFPAASRTQLSPSHFTTAVERQARPSLGLLVIFRVKSLMRSCPQRQKWVEVLGSLAAPCWTCQGEGAGLFASQPVQSWGTYSRTNRLFCAADFSFLSQVGQSCPLHARQEPCPGPLSMGMYFLGLLLRFQGSSVINTVGTALWASRRVAQGSIISCQGFS